MKLHSLEKDSSVKQFLLALLNSPTGIALIVCAEWQLLARSVSLPVLGFLKVLVKTPGILGLPYRLISRKWIIWSEDPVHFKLKELLLT